MTHTASLLTGPSVKYPKDALIDALVEDQAAVRPDSAALAWKGTITTYAQLVEGAQRVARLLHSRGIRPGDVVAVRCHPSPDLAVALLGVLKCGAAYAAVPPDWPQARYEQLIRAAGIRFCLYDMAGPDLSGTATGLPLRPDPADPPGEPPAVRRDGNERGGNERDGNERDGNERDGNERDGNERDGNERGGNERGGNERGGNERGGNERGGNERGGNERGGNERGGNERGGNERGGNERGGSDACCVFLTSGSTGGPKVILAPHRGVVRIALDPTCTLGGPMVMPQLAPIPWDAFAMELWVPLITGGTCHLPATSHTAGAGIRAAIGAGVNAMFLTTALLEALLEDDPGALTGLELLLTGGERCSPAHLAACARRYPGLRLVHVYGPAEATIFSTACDLAELGQFDEVPIGRPVANTTVCLLDDEGRPAEPGAVGEIAIGGDGLALRYVAAAQETARRFRTVELAGSRQRVYLSGDLARTDEAGRLIFMGRKDRMVKIRGVRIEPDEVERVIEDLPGVGRAVVLALPLDQDRKTGLAAFHTSRARGAITAELVRGHVAAALPAAFVPDVVIAVDSLPLNSTGKVDHRALARLVPGHGAPHIGGDGAGTLTTVLQVAAELLGYRVAAEDDLFDRGATSMTAIRMATRLARLSDRPVTGFDVLEARTPGRLALVIDKRAVPPGRQAPVAAPGGDTRPVPESLRKFWSASVDVPDLHETIVPMLFRLSGRLDVAALRAALDAVVARHEVLRSLFWCDADGRLTAQVLPPDAVRGVLTVDTAAGPGLDETAQEARRWLLAPYSLVGTIPIRARLIPLDDKDHLLAVVVQHIAFDAWSVGLFWQDLVSAYDAAAGGQSAGSAFGGPSPEFFSAFDIQRRDQEGRVAQALSYWSELVKDVPWVQFPGRSPYLPLHGPAEEVELPLTDEIMAAAGRAAARFGATATAVLFAAYLRRLRAFTGRPDLAVSSPVAGRFLPASERAVGCFAGMLPMRVPPSATEPTELVAAAAEQLRRAMDAPLLSMDDIYPELAEGVPRHPLFQVYLLLEETAPDRLALRDLTAEQIRVRPMNWISEISLELRPHPGLGGLLRYRTDAISAADAARFVDDWIADVVSLSAVLTDPVLTDPVLTDPVLTDPVLTDPVVTGTGAAGGERG